MGRLGRPAGVDAEVDVRGLEHEAAMARVFGALGRLRPGRSMLLIHDLRPTLLYPRLEAEGLRHATDEPCAGLVRVVISRPAPRRSRGRER